MVNKDECNIYIYGVTRAVFRILKLESNENGHSGLLFAL